jgi:hypothetical protein
MKPEPMLLYSVRPTHDDVCLQRLSEFYGLERRSVETSALNAELERAADHDLCLLASAKTIHEWRRDHAPDPGSALDSLRQKAAFVFVYGFAPGMAEIASDLSNGTIRDIRRLTRTDLCYNVSSSQPEITRQFSGLSFGPANTTTDSGFVCPADFRSTVPLATLEDMPFWMCVQQGGCVTFLLACSAIADIEEQVNAVDLFLNIGNSAARQKKCDAPSLLYAHPKWHVLYSCQRKRAAGTYRADEAGIGGGVSGPE